MFNFNSLFSNLSHNLPGLFSQAGQANADASTSDQGANASTNTSNGQTIQLGQTNTDGFHITTTPGQSGSYQGSNFFQSPPQSSSASDKASAKGSNAAASASASASSFAYAKGGKGGSIRITLGDPKPVDPTPPEPPTPPVPPEPPTPPVPPEPPKKPVDPTPPEPPTPPVPPEPPTPPVPPEPPKEPVDPGPEYHCIETIKLADGTIQQYNTYKYSSTDNNIGYVTNEAGERQFFAVTWNSNLLYANGQELNDPTLASAAQNNLSSLWASIPDQEKIETYGAYAEDLGKLPSYENISKLIKDYPDRITLIPADSEDPSVPSVPDNFQGNPSLEGQDYTVIEPE